MRTALSTAVDPVQVKKRSEANKEWHLVFLRRPSKFIAAKNSSRVASIQFAVNRLEVHSAIVVLPFIVRSSQRFCQVTYNLCDIYIFRRHYRTLNCPVQCALLELHSSVVMLHQGELGESQTAVSTGVSEMLSCGLVGLNFLTLNTLS